LAREKKVGGTPIKDARFYRLATISCNGSLSLLRGHEKKKITMQTYLAIAVETPEAS
jgi:hypothetical protein